jgi:prepilin-type N-terminal cleavage/methylation domain-containing protein
MKEERGFTLVEMMVVVSITVLLLAWAVPSYSTWKKKHDIENQMIQLYSDLQFGRMTAYGNKVVSGILWGGGASFSSYQIMTDTTNQGFISSNSTQIGATVHVGLKVPPIIAAPANQSDVMFDGRGFLYSSAGTPPPITFYVTPSSGAAMDCVAVTSTRITLGKMNGGSCSPK